MVLIPLDSDSVRAYEVHSSSMLPAVPHPLPYFKLLTRHCPSRRTAQAQPEARYIDRSRNPLAPYSPSLPLPRPPLLPGRRGAPECSPEYCQQDCSIVDLRQCSESSAVPLLLASLILNLGSFKRIANSAAYCSANESI